MTKSERKAALLAKFPTKLHGKVEKLCSSRSLRAAVDLFCVECMGCSEGYVKEIRFCTAPLCPLFEFRPYQLTPQKRGLSEPGAPEEENVTPTTSELPRAADGPPRSR